MGHLDVVRLLLDKGAKVDLGKKDGWTPLMSASKNGHLDVVRLLKDHKSLLQKGVEKMIKAIV